MITIETLDHNFRGIGKLNNKIIFVKNALPGEVVEIKIDKEKKRYIEAHPTKYLKTSKERIIPKCQYFELCGGCDLMHVNYTTQLKFKEEKIKNIIKKYLKKDIKINSIVYDKSENYRNKTKFQVKNKIGFFKNNSNNFIAINNCILANEKINSCIPYLNDINLKNVKTITCRTAQNDLMIIIETSKKDNIDISQLKEIADSIYINNKLVYGKPKIVEKLDSYNYVISPESFFQINKNICLKLYTKIKEYIGKEKNVLDLYCGCGSIGIFASEKNNVVGVEINESAINDANDNIKINNLRNINFICGDSSIKDNFKSDIIIVDPPRKGLDDKTIEKINDLKPKKLIYVSCDPMTLVRDLNRLNLFKIIEITPYDMFPQTKHIETLCLLELK